MTKIEHTSFALNNPHVIDFAMRNCGLSRL
jgi:hypothetical protein